MYDLKMKQVRIIDLERGGRDMPAAEYYAHIGLNSTGFSRD